MDSWAVSACYPRSTFYPISDGASTRPRQITKTSFRFCSTCQSRSQALFCLYTRTLISIQRERTFAHLRYSLGADRPSQTAHLTRSVHRITAHVRNLSSKGWYFTVSSAQPNDHASQLPTYPTHRMKSPSVRLQ